MTAPLVSIIVPVYNVREYLPSCIDSLLNQDFKGIEIILVNDGSTDGSGEICDAYAGNHPEIRVFNQENAGVSAARNAGIKNAGSPYISFVDADDFIAAGMISRLFNLITRCDIAAGAIKRYYSPGKILDYKNKYGVDTFLEGNVILSDFLESNSGFCGSVCNKMFRKDLMDGLSFTNINMGEDTLFLWEYLKKTKTAAFVPGAVYFYRIRADSAAHSNFSKEHLSSLDVWNIILRDTAGSYPALYRNALNAFGHGHFAVFNRISLSKNAGRECIKQAASGFKPLIREYILTAEAGMTDRLSAILGVYAFPVYKALYRIYKRIKMGLGRQ